MRAVVVVWSALSGRVGHSVATAIYQPDQPRSGLAPLQHEAQTIPFNHISDTRPEALAEGERAVEPRQAAAELAELQLWLRDVGARPWTVGQVGTPAAEQTCAVRMCVLEPPVARLTPLACPALRTHLCRVLRCDPAGAGASLAAGGGQPPHALPALVSGRALARGCCTCARLAAVRG